jgi:transposase InsO family protein
MRDELLALEQFNTLLAARVLVADWRIEYNTYRPHSDLGMLTPVESSPRTRGGGPANLSSHSG